jgi:acyl carrier protein
MDTLKNQLRAIYIQALQLPIDPADIKDKKLVATLGIDSIAMMEIIVRVENAFHIAIEDADASPELVDSLDAFATYITSKQQNPRTPEA